MENVLTKCPKCRLPLERKGNWLRCPGCKSFFQITLETPELLGYCPHGCGEKLSESNYISWGILSCPHCKKRTVSRGEGNQFRLLQYIGNCPTCDTPMAEDDRFGIDAYVCKECGSYAVKRDEPYHLYQKTDTCPMCGKSLCADDWDVKSGALRCSYCNNSYKTIDNKAQISKSELYALTNFSYQAFKETCFDRLLRFAPKDIFEKMRIKEAKILYFPFYKQPNKESQPLFNSSYDSYLSQKAIEISDNCLPPYPSGAFDIELSTTTDKYKLDDHPRCYTANKEDMVKDASYQIEFVPISKDRAAESIIEYKPLFLMKYTYKGEERAFYNWDACSDDELKESISSVNLPVEVSLNRTNWFKKENNIIVLLIVGAFIYLNFNGSFFSQIALVALGLFVLIKIQSIMNYIGNLWRSSCQKKKLKDLEKIYHYHSSEDYQDLAKYYVKLKNVHAFPIYK